MSAHSLPPAFLTEVQSPASRPKSQAQPQFQVAGGNPEESKLIVVAPSQWPRISSGWACKPILDNERRKSLQGGFSGKVSLLPKRQYGKRCSSLLALKMITSGCDVWTFGSHSRAMRRAHVEPSLQLKVAEKRDW